MNAPVKSDFIISGPNPVNADIINNPPKILPIVQIQLTFNNEFKKLFSIINFGLNALVIIVNEAAITTTIIDKVGK